MANYTENLKLELPNGNEFYLIDKFNENFTKIDGVVSNPNLLDNPWFTVNQRNFTSSNISNYCVDRWISAQGTTTLSESVISFVATSANTGIYQRLDLDRIEVGKEYTVSIKLSDGTILSKTLTTIDGSVTGKYDESLPYMYEVTKKQSYWIVYATYVENIGQGASIRAVKLEYGSVSTLANDHAPDYATELLKCQRYFQNLTNINTAYYPAFADASNNVIFSIAIACAMRTLPTVTATMTRLLYANGSKSVNLSTVSLFRTTETNYNLQFAYAHGLAQYTPCHAGLIKLELSADL